MFGAVDLDGFPCTMDGDGDGITIVDIVAYEIQEFTVPADPDCDGDGLPDDCTIRQCTGDPSCSDCNRNGIPDGCGIAHGTSTDCDGNGVPDEWIPA